MSTLFKPIQTTDALLDSIPIVAGKFIICVDSGKVYMDTAHEGAARRIPCGIPAEAQYAPITRTAINIDNFEQILDPPGDELESYAYEIAGYVIATHVYPDIDATVLDQVLTTIEYNATTYKSTIRIHRALHGELYTRYMSNPSAEKHYVYADVIKDVSAAYDPSSLTTLTGNSVVLSPFGRYRWTASGICELTASDEWLSSGFETALIIITYETGAVLTINGMTVADMDELTAPGVYTCYVENQDGTLLFKVV